MNTKVNSMANEMYKKLKNKIAYIFSNIIEKKIFSARLILNVRNTVIYITWKLVTNFTENKKYTV